MVAFTCGFFMPLPNAQVITISQELGLKNDYAYSILGWVEDDMLLFRDKGYKFFIQSFDRNLHLKWERELYLGESRADIIGAIAHHDRFHVLFGIRIKGVYHIQHHVYDHSVNLIDSSSLSAYENAFVTPRIFMEESEDKSKVLLFEYQNRGLTLLSYDLSTKQIANVQRLPLEGKNLIDDFRSIVVTNAGEFYVALQSNTLQQKTQYLHLYRAAPGFDQMLHDTIRLGDVQLLDVYPEYDHLQHSLVITGLYGGINSTRATGFYFIRYEHNKKAMVNYLPFDEDLLTEINGRGSSSLKGLSDFQIRQLALRQDGGVIIIAEMVKEFSRRSSLPMERGSGTYLRDGWIDYYFEDMILFAVHPDGKEHWQKVLRKRQYSQDDGAMYSSFMLFKTPERLRFLFNDEIKHENTVGGYEVTGSGYVERKTVFNTDYHKLKLRFMDGIQVAHNECIIPSERNNRLNLVRILFKE
jgi:hypothetical protein